MSPLRRLICGVLLAVLVPFGFAEATVHADPDPTFRGAGVQTVSLQPGWNWVSLHVVPSSRAVRDVLGSALPHVVVVRDVRGNHFVPSHGVEHLREWDWREGYMVFARQAVTFTVEGTLIDPTASPVPLERGWNLVPYLGQETLPVEEAFASLGNALALVRDVNGNVYKPGLTNSTLRTVAPGTAYQVFVSAPASFAAPAPRPPVGSEHRVPTLAALKALRTAELEPGARVVVEGYHTPGDGGGGTFTLATAPEYACDPGLVVCPEDQLGPELVERTTFASNRTRTYTVARPPVAFGTLTLTLSGTNAGGQPWSLEIPDAYMHGTVFQSSGSWNRVFEHERGRFTEQGYGSGRAFHVLLSRHLGSPWQVEAVFRYRSIEGPLRWIRTHDEAGRPLPDQGQVWPAVAFGCRAHEDSPYFDNTNCLNWALMLAKHTNAQHPGRVAEIRLTQRAPGRSTVYYYSKSIQIPEGITLAGDAGAEVVEAVDDFGNRFRPVRARADAVVLRVLPETAEGCMSCGHALEYYLMRRDFGDPHHLPPKPAPLLGNNLTAIHPETGVRRWAVRDLVLDGNQEYHDIWDSRWTTELRENVLRNAPGYSGIVQSSHGAKDVEGQRLTIERVYVTGYAATGILTASVADTTFLRDVASGNVAYNRAGYFISVINAENLTTFGQSWGHFDIYAGIVRNLVAERIARGRGSVGSVFNWRGGDTSTAEGCNQSTWLRRSCGSTIEGVYADLRGGNRALAMTGLGPGIHIRDATIIQTSTDFFSVWIEAGSGSQSMRYHDNRFDNFRLFFTRGFSNASVIGEHHFNQSFFRNIIAENEGNWQRFINLTTSTRGRNAPFEVIYDHIGSQEKPIKATEFAEARFSSEERPHRFFFINSFFDTIGVIRGRSGPRGGTGRLNSICPEETVCNRIQHSQLYFRNVMLAAGPNTNSDGELFFEIARFENVTDPTNGATSEDRGAFTCDGGRTYTIPTNLYWRPHATRGSFTTSGGPRVASIEYVNARGQVVGPMYLEGTQQRDARRPFARITFEQDCPAGTRVTWEAAVSRWLDENGQPVSLPSWYQP